MKLKNYIEGLILATDEKESTGKIIAKQNLDRLSFAAMLAIPVSLAHILVFWINLHTGTPIEYLWRIGIIRAHSMLFVLLLAVYIAIFFHRRSIKSQGWVITILPHLGFVLVLGMGVLITFIDQRVTGSINPYFLACIFIPLIVTIPPAWSILYFILSYGLFLILIPLHQHDTNILLSNRLNGVSAVAFGFVLSISLWRLKLSQVRQENYIQQQQEKLELQNTYLLQLSEELQTINDSKDKFFSVLAHDLRSPVSGFMGLTGIMADQMESLSEKQVKEMAMVMKDSANHIYDLLNNLLEWSLVQQGHITFKPEVLNLSQVVDKCIQLFLAQAREKGITLNHQVPGGLAISADRHMLKVIIRNLVSNALKFTSEGGRIKVSAVLINGSININVKDTGMGMTPEIAASLFTFSDSINRSGTSGEPSAGLGLTLCREFVEKHGGRIQVKSDAGKGSTFTVSLPQAQEGTQAAYPSPKKQKTDPLK